MKAKYKAKVNCVVKKVLFHLLFSLLKLVRDMWNKFLSIKHSSEYFEHLKYGVNLTM